jgi:carboxypeptidase Taq
MNIQETIREFRDYTDKMKLREMALSAIFWDQETVAPKKSAEQMSKVIGLLSEELHALGIAPKMKEYLDILDSYEAKDEAKHEMDEITKGIHRVLKIEYNKLKNIPADEYGKYSELKMKSMSVWKEAKADNDFAKFAPYLKEIIEYEKRFIGYRGYKDHPYNTLLDDYEPGMTAAVLDEYFAKLKDGVVPLLKKVTDSAKTINDDFAHLQVEKPVQEKISVYLMDKLGYDRDRGVLAESEHPFSMSFHRDDCRITTKYKEDSFLSSYFSVAHEIGHAMYEMGTREDMMGTHLDSGISNGIHESQSRFYENIICRSREFWANIYDDIKAILGERFIGISLEEFYEASNKINPSLIRVEADELTYSLHVMVRYEMEKLIIGGDIDVMELPKLWNDKYEEYLGIRPPTDTEGILQDVHWSEGYFGYFPSYSLGNAYGGQLLHYMKKDLDTDKLIADGNIVAITNWLSEKIHKHGSLYEPNELLMNAIGEPLNADYFIEYLNGKYGQIYGF